MTREVEMTVEQWPLERLVPYVHNARTHSEKQIDQLCASITEFGWTIPILVGDDGMVIAGHGRLMAAKKLGYTSAPVIIASGLTPAQQRAYVLADNQLASNAGWDQELLAFNVAELKAMDFDVAVLGFTAGEIDRLLTQRKAGLTGADDAPPLPAVAVSQADDLWLAGAHRILCGNSTVAADVKRALGSVAPHLMVTDPPYGVEYDAAWRNKTLRADGSPVGGRAIGKVENDDRADWREVWKLFPGSVAYVWHGDRMGPIVGDGLVDAGFALRAQIIWAKSQFVIGRGHYHQQHEPCWYAVRSRNSGTGHWNGDRKQSTLWQIDKPHKSETGHSTQKPVECMLRPIENNSSIGQAVFEPFSGSGTTVIACEQSGRACIAIELSPAYVDVAVQRWQAFTGNEATLDGDGRTFAQIKTDREALTA